LNTSNFQYAFIGVMFCIVAIWATMFVGSKQTSIPINRTTDVSGICSCYNSHMFLNLDEFGVIRHRGTPVSIEEVIYTLDKLRGDSWVFGVIINANSKTKHQQVVSLSTSIQREFTDLYIGWESNET
jgi:biopolymer transport protein ExbD